MQSLITWGKGVASFQGRPLFLALSSLAFSVLSIQLADEESKNKASSGQERERGSHAIGWNVVTWPHPTAREAGKCVVTPLQGEVTALGIISPVSSTTISSPEIS